MEASNLGAYLANKTDEQVQLALEILAEGIRTKIVQLWRPAYLIPGNDSEMEYKNTGPAENVIKALGEPIDMPSLGVPTWRYGHEPSNRFATW